MRSWKYTYKKKKHYSIIILTSSLSLRPFVDSEKEKKVICINQNISKLRLWANHPEDQFPVVSRLNFFINFLARKFK